MLRWVQRSQVVALGFTSAFLVSFLMIRTAGSAGFAAAAAGAAAAAAGLAAAAAAALALASASFFALSASSARESLKSTMLILPNGHNSAQREQPTHQSSMITSSDSLRRIEPTGHCVMQSGSRHER